MNPLAKYGYLLLLLPLSALAYADFGYAWRVATTALIFILLAASANLLSGVSGLMSLGQGAIYGLGAYASALLSTKIGIGAWFALPLAGVAASLIAAEDVSFTLAEGELVGLIGPNGAGKTTLFNLITGFTPPSCGQIRWRQKIITGAAVHRIARLGISRTVQNLRVFPNLTVFDNVSVGAIGRYRYGLLDTLLHRAARAKMVGEATLRALEQTGLLPYSNELAANLSYGKRKYLEIARALAFDPQLLILDEPEAGLSGRTTGRDILRR